MKNFFLATRPKTLVAAIIPPLMSYALAHAHFFEIDVKLVICCIFGALFIQLATNFFNDLIDFQKGADKVRHGPMRVTSTGLVTPTRIRSWAIYSLLAACLFAIPLIMKAGTIILIPGVVSLYLTYGYTGGPLPLAYKGLGEIFVFLFFGLFSVLGSYYIYTSSMHQDAGVLATIYGLLTMTLICVNNLRDREEDKKVQKLTLATRMNEKAYKFLALVTIYLPYLLVFKLKLALTLWPLLLALPVSFKLALIVFKEKREGLNAGLKFAGIHLIVFSLLLYLGFNYEHFFS
jgi:1,4-dihydroxy-2-naphthoate octaprenyltransferase